MLVELASHNDSWTEEVADTKARQLCQWCKENEIEAHYFCVGWDSKVVIHLDLDTEQQYAKLHNFILKELGSNLDAIHLVWMLDAVNGAGDLEVSLNVLDDEVLKTVKMHPMYVNMLKKNYFKDPTSPSGKGTIFTSQAVLIQRLIANLERNQASLSALEVRATFLEERLLQREMKTKSQYAA